MDEGGGSRFFMEVPMDSLKNYKSTKKYVSTKVLITHMDCPIKWESTKVQKV